MKKATYLVGGGILLFVLYWVLGFVYTASIANIFFRFELVTEKQWFWIAFVGGLSVAIIAIGITLAVINSKTKTKTGNWWSQNWPTVILIYAISVIFFFSVRRDLIWSLDEMKDVLSLQWTIFGISIAIFLVWNVIILEFLRKHRPHISQQADTFEIIKHIGDKGKFYQQANRMLNSVVLLIINLIVLLLTTTMVYVSAREVTNVSQNATLLSLYLCTNTILQLFLDILVPLNEKKRLMLKSSKVTAKDVDYQNRVDDRIKKTLTAMEQIEQLGAISDEQKKEIYSELIKNVTDMANDYPVANLLEENAQNE